MAPPATSRSWTSPCVSRLTELVLGSASVLRTTHSTAIDAALALVPVVSSANRLVEATKPWELARREKAGDAVAGEQLDAVLTTLIGSCRTLARELAPFLPAGSARLAMQLGEGRLVATPRPAFPRLR